LFRRILEVGRSRFETDRHSYFIDAQLGKVPQGGALADADLPGLLEQFDSRQVLHVCFGSVLDAFGPEIRSDMARYEEDYMTGLEAHFARHIAPLI
jgi:hypothetical protein